MNNGIDTVAVFGDSILKGVVTGTGSGRMYDIVKENSLSLAADALGFTLKNYSVFGNVMSKGHKTLMYQLEKGLETDIAIIEGGGNDCNVNWAALKKDPSLPEIQQVPVDEYIRIVDEMVQELRSRRITPVIATVIPLVAERWFEQLCINGDRERIMRYLHADTHNLYRANELYALRLTEYALSHGVQTVDLRGAMLELTDFNDYMCQDGIHPNLRGYAYLALVWEKRLPLLKKEF